MTCAVQLHEDENTSPVPSFESRNHSNFSLLHVPQYRGVGQKVLSSFCPKRYREATEEHDRKASCFTGLQLSQSRVRLRHPCLLKYKDQLVSFPLGRSLRSCEESPTTTKELTLSYSHISCKSYVQPSTSITQTFFFTSRPLLLCCLANLPISVTKPLINI